MKKNVKYIIFGLVVLVIILIIGFLVFIKNDQDEVREIDGVSFSLNNIKDEFLKTNYAKENSCKVKVLENGLTITCNKRVYDYTFNGIELGTITDNNGLEIFKYVVNSIEVLHGAKYSDYLDELDKFIDGQISIDGLKYLLQEDGKLKLSINVLEKLDLVRDWEIINDIVIKEISDVDYEYKNGNYIINGINIKSDNQELIYVLSATFVGNNQGKYFTINYYNINNELIKSTKVNLQDYNNYGSPYLNFVVTSRFSVEEFGNVAKYSISLS